jgi:hypothetical protein
MILLFDRVKQNTDSEREMRSVSCHAQFLCRLNATERFNEFGTIIPTKRTTLTTLNL